jgi:predicted dehydrogenase
MGRLHAKTVHRLAAGGSDFALTRVFDRHRGRAQALAETFEAGASADLHEFSEQVDVAVVAVPTAAHFKIARTLLESGLDLLIEKPFTSVLAEARTLVSMGRGEGRILQVGHVEWYNPAWRAAAERVGRPRRIEVERLQPPARRGRDIDVIQDLMLHDLDWTTRWIDRPLLEVAASGRAVRGRLEEVSAELSFDGGCCVELRASRLADARHREVRFEGDAGSEKVDLEAPGRVAEGHEAPGPAQPRASTGLCHDPLEAQWLDFMRATESRIEPTNGGDVGIAALALVERVREAVESGVRSGRLEREL